MDGKYLVASSFILINSVEIEMLIGEKWLNMLIFLSVSRKVAENYLKTAF